MELALARSGTGPPLLLIHGFASFGRFWEPILPALTPHHTVLVPDLPGHGSSPSLPVAPTVDALVDVLERLLDELGHDRADVAGHSLGGLLALELARRGRARSVCALAPSGFATALEKRWVYGVLRGQRALATVLRPWVPRLARSRAVRTATLSLSAARPWAMDPDWATATAMSYLATRGFDEILAAIDPNPVVARFAGIEARVLLVYGERDLVVPARGALRYRRWLPEHTGYRWIAGAGHALTTDAPAETAAAVLDATAASRALLVA